MSDYQTMATHWTDRRDLNVGQVLTQEGEQGFVLFTTLVIMIIVGILAVSGHRSSELTEVLAGNAIQRSRAFQAAEGALIEGELKTATRVEQRVFSSVNATDGIFARDSLADHWWREAQFSGSREIEDIEYPAVTSPPAYVVEEIGTYVSDGGSGIVSLDRGAAGYGRRTSTGREVVLYRLQSEGTGTTNAAQAVVESLYVRNQ